MGGSGALFASRQCAAPTWPRILSPGGSRWCRLRAGKARVSEKRTDALEAWLDQGGSHATRTTTLPRRGQEGTRRDGSGGRGESSGGGRHWQKPAVLRTDGQSSGATVSQMKSVARRERKADGATPGEDARCRRLAERARRERPRRPTSPPQAHHSFHRPVRPLRPPPPGPLALSPPALPSPPFHPPLTFTFFAPLPSCHIERAHSPSSLPTPISASPLSSFFSFAFLPLLVSVLFSVFRCDATLELWVSRK